MLLISHVLTTRPMKMNKRCRRVWLARRFLPSQVVKWISSQRNGQGGFVSTQDTVVALQALASFEASQKQQVQDGGELSASRVAWTPRE